MEVDPAIVQIDAGEERAQHRPLLGRRKLRPAAREPRGTIQQPVLLGGVGHGLSERPEHLRFAPQEPAQAFDDEPFQVGGGHAPAGRGSVAASGDQRVRDVVAVPPARLVGVARRHAPAGAVAQQPGQQARMAGAAARAPLLPLLRQAGLHRVPEIQVDDGRVLAGVDRALVRDLAPVQPVAQQRVQRAPGEWLPRLAPDAVEGELLLQQPHRAEREVEAEHAPDGVGLGLVHHQLALARLVAERHRAAHPHALALGGGDLVADALARDLALELREGQQHVQRQPAHEVAVLNCWVTDTKEAPWASSTSTILAKPASERVSRSTL